MCIIISGDLLSMGVQITISVRDTSSSAINHLHCAGEGEQHSKSYRPRPHLIPENFAKLPKFNKKPIFLVGRVLKLDVE